MHTPTATLAGEEVITMLAGPPSDAALRDTFERVLTGILDGSMAAAPECNGLDEQTRAALNALVGATSSRASKIFAARTEFVRQLDGTHREQSHAEWVALLKRHLANHRLP
jgi:hypothetical protein